MRLNTIAKLAARTCALAAPALLLAACGEDAPAAGDGDAREASGEVLEGSISDAMIPIDELTSSPPLEQDAPETSSGDGATGATAPEAGETPAEEPAAEEPAEAEAPAE